MGLPASEWDDQMRKAGAVTTLTVERHTLQGKRTKRVMKIEVCIPDAEGVSFEMVGRNIIQYINTHHRDALRDAK